MKVGIVCLVLCFFLVIVNFEIMNFLFKYIELVVNVFVILFGIGKKMALCFVFYFI